VADWLHWRRSFGLLSARREKSSASFFNGSFSTCVFGVSSVENSKYLNALVAAHIARDAWRKIWQEISGVRVCWLKSESSV
jgi:hypothetical protein